MEPTVSVIIPTYNGVQKVQNTIRALEWQTYKAFEVIIVVDGSLDNTVKVLQKQQFILPNFQIIEQNNRGRSGSRNRGAKEASGELLVFFDDDMRPLPDCIQRHVKHHQQHSQTLGVGNVPEDFAKMETDFQRYKAHLSRKWVEPLKANNGLIPPDKPFLTAANFSISKDLFWQLGGFDKNLTDAEDFDLAVRASWVHVPIYFLNEAIAWHDDFITCRSYIQRQRQYRVANQTLRKLKPALYLHQDQYIYNEATNLKRLIYNLLSHRFWVKLIDRTSFLQWLPRSVRYKLYSIIVTGLSIHFPNRTV